MLLEPLLVFLYFCSYTFSLNLIYTRLTRMYTMRFARTTLDEAHLQAQRLGIELLETTRFKRGTPLLYKCSKGHEFRRTLNQLKKISYTEIACPRCKRLYSRLNYGNGSPKLDQRGKLASRLALMNIELVGEWHGCNFLNTFRCLSCDSEWKTKGRYVVNEGRCCPICVPQRKRMKRSANKFHRNRLEKIRNTPVIGLENLMAQLRA